MKLTNTLMALAMTLGLAACGPDGGQMQSAGGAGGGRAGTGGGGTGAGGRAPDAGTTTIAERLIGTWRYTAGDMICSCDDGSTVVDSVDGTQTVRFSAGIAANQVIATDDDGCALTCDVSQSTVNCQGATCQYDGAHATITSDVYTIVGDELNEISLAVVAIDGGPTCQCVQSSGVLVRAP